MVWAIAIRNLWQHRAKTLIIGILITIAITLAFAGNAFIDSMIKNISSIFTDYYTGDVLITSSETMGAGVFGAQSDEIMTFPVIPVMKDYDRAMEIVASVPGVKSVTHQLSGYALINLEQAGMDYACFFGVEPSYFDAMPGIEILDGRLLKPGEEGMLLHYDIWKKLKEQKNIEYKIGDKVQLNNYGVGGMRIHEVPLVGIFKFPRGNKRMFSMSFLDDRSLRYLLGKNSGTKEKVAVNAEATALLDADVDNLFADASTDSGAGNAPVTTASGDVFDILGGVKQAPAVEDAKQSWHFIVIKLEKGVDADAVIKSLNAKFDDEDLLLTAQGWWESAMPDSATYSGLKILFNVAIFILGFVSIIIIMNTLVVSVMERTSEIGTMRALGAQKSFVVKMFVAETAFITFVFGMLGMAIGAAIIIALNRIGIPTDNDALRYLGGGSVMRPVISTQPVMLSIFFIAFIALFSWVYPVLIALKVSPLKAITSD